MQLNSKGSRLQILLSRFRANRGGNVAMLFGLALVPIVIVTGMGVDYMRASSERTRLQQAVDATALALAHEPRSLTVAELQAKADTFFAASFTTNMAAMPKAVVTKNGARIIVNSEMAVPTTLMQIAGQQSMVVHTTATVSPIGRQIELALVLDNTGSMGSSGKMTALKAAATMFLDQLAAAKPAPGDIRVSLVPYNLWVNVGTAQAGASWLDTSKISLPSWKGCVEDRQPDSDIHANPGALYPASACNWVPEPITPLVDMSVPSSLTTLKARVAAMDSDGNTNVTIGLVWGLATLTPNSPLPGVGPRDFGTANVDKIIVILTDGVNTSRKGRWGSVTSAAADERTLLACANVKDPAKKIRLVTIRLIEGDDAMLRQCASSPADFYAAAKSSDVTPIFKNVLNGLFAVRLSN